MAAKVKKAAKKEVKAAITAKVGKASGKTAKLAAKSAAVAETAPSVDADEAEEQEDAAASSSNSAGGNAAALAAASGATEMSASFKNFRHHPDMENFYRFIYENDLRHEALAIIDQMAIEKQNRKMVKGAKANAH